MEFFVPDVSASRANPLDLSSIVDEKLNAFTKDVRAEFQTIRDKVIAVAEAFKDAVFPQLMDATSSVSKSNDAWIKAVNAIVSNLTAVSAQITELGGTALASSIVDAQASFRKANELMDMLLVLLPLVFGSLLLLVVVHLGASSLQLYYALSDRRAGHLPCGCCSAPEKNKNVSLP